VLVLARTRDPATGRSVLSGRQTTCLPRYMERMAYLATAWRLGRYYRTYPAYVQDEVEAALDDPGSQFQRGPLTLTARGTATDDTPAFAVTDRNYLSALARRRLPVRPPLLRPPATHRPGRRLASPSQDRRHRAAARESPAHDDDKGVAGCLVIAQSGRSE
jgi:hypothetical protein